MQQRTAIPRGAEVQSLVGRVLREQLEQTRPFILERNALGCNRHRSQTLLELLPRHRVGCGYNWFELQGVHKGP